MRAKAASRSSTGNDRRIVLWLAGALLFATILFSLYGAGQEDDNPEPTTLNAGSHGTKAAFLLLSRLGYTSERWESPLANLRNVDAASTTLILTEPTLPVKSLKQTQQDIAEFLTRGGRVLATGVTGARLLPEGSAAAPERVYQGLCFTEPEGAGPLARAGQVSMNDPARWSTSGPRYIVEQRCGPDAAVVRYKVGEGEAIWWNSPMPLTNAGLTEDADVKLMLASIGGPGRRILFDEYLHQTRETVGNLLGGLPWWALSLQALLVALFLVLSRGRRSGPIRRPLHLPRSSPLEFAESMGRLYSRAGATPAATEAARSRLLEYLRDQCGMPQDVLRADAPALSQALAERIGGDWTGLEWHLQKARDAATNPVPVKTALRLVKALDADLDRLQQETQLHRQPTLIER